MITEFSDRNPRLSGVIIAALFTIIPGIFMFIVDFLSGGELNTALILFLYAVALQLVLCFCVERPILVMLPFLTMLIGFIACEIIYTLSMGMRAPGVGPGKFAAFVSSAIVIVFGCESAGIIAALMGHVIISFIRKVCDAIIYR